MIYCLHGNNVFHLGGDHSLDAYGGRQRASLGDSLREFLREVSARPDWGLFSVVSQISPSGAGNFEDLSILDTSDPNQCLVVAAVRVGDDIIICRRLYCGGL